jgi:hypothetical protein
MVLAVIYGICALAGLSGSGGAVVAWAVALPIWIASALLVRLGRKRQARERALRGGSGELS